MVGLLAGVVGVNGEVALEAGDGGLVVLLDFLHGVPGVSTSCPSLFNVMIP